MPKRPRRREKQTAGNKTTRPNIRWFLIGLITLAAVIVVAVIIVNNNNNSSNTVKPLAFVARPDANGMSMGDPKATVKVEDFSDFQCPICADFSTNKEQAIVDKYVSTGKVQVTFIPFSFIGPESVTAAQAAYCAADQNKFWQFKDVLYTHQGAENSGAFSNDKLDQFASQTGLNMADYRACFSSNKYAQKVQDDLNTGTSRQVPGTPYFFVNGKGPLEAKALTQAIDDALAGK